MESLKCPNVPAMQVLSQPSYTPTVASPIIFHHLCRHRNRGECRRQLRRGNQPAEDFPVRNRRQAFEECQELCVVAD
jgi:hypothetical protein